ncbi:hypothetical protein ACFYQQ_29560, partial [Streptomyces sp. NPDC005496]
MSAARGAAVAGAGGGAGRQVPGGREPAGASVPGSRYAGRMLNTARGRADPDPDTGADPGTD